MQEAIIVGVIVGVMVGSILSIILGLPGKLIGGKGRDRFLMQADKLSESYNFIIGRRPRDLSEVEILGSDLTDWIKNARPLVKGEVLREPSIDRADWTNPRYGALLRECDVTWATLNAKITRIRKARP